MGQKGLVNKFISSVGRMFIGKRDLDFILHVNIQKDINSQLQEKRKEIRLQEDWISMLNRKYSRLYNIENNEIYKKRHEELKRLNQMSAALYQAYDTNRDFSYIEYE